MPRVPRLHDVSAYLSLSAEYDYDSYVEPTASFYTHDGVASTSTATLQPLSPATSLHTYASPAWTSSPQFTPYTEYAAELEAAEPQFATYTGRSPLPDADRASYQYSRSSGPAYNFHSTPSSSAYSHQPPASVPQNGTVQSVYTIPAPPPRGVRASTFACTICGWIATTTEQYDLHLKAHDGDCLFQCFIDGCEAAYETAQELHQHSVWHEQPALGSKRSWYSEGGSGDYADPVFVAGQAHVSTPRRAKRSRFEPVAPITPVTPSLGFTYGQQQRPVMPYHSASETDAAIFSLQPEQPPVKRAASCDCTPRKRSAQLPLSSRASYESVVPKPKPNSTSFGSIVLPKFVLPASPATSHTSSYAKYSYPTDSTSSTPRSRATRFPRQPQLASPIQIPSSAPVDQGRFQPYPDVGSSSMSVSYSLPHTPPRGRTIHSCRREEPGASQEQVADEGYTARHMPHVLRSPVSPAVPTYGNGPALVPIPGTPPETRGGQSAHSSRAASPAPSPRSSGDSSSYGSAQAALVSAASMNRLLSRLPVPPATPPPAQPSSAGSDFESSSVAKPERSSPTSTPAAPASTARSASAPEDSQKPGQLVSAVHPRFRQPPARSNPPKDNLKMHKCTFEGCGKEFKRHEHVRRHERTHTLEKPFMCDFPGCKRWFS